MERALMSKQEVAKRLNVSPWTVKRLADRGTLPAIQLSNQIIRFDPDDVEKHLLKCKTKAVEL